MNFVSKSVKRSAVVGQRKWIRGYSDLNFYKILLNVSTENAIEAKSGIYGGFFARATKICSETNIRGEENS